LRAYQLYIKERDAWVWVGTIDAPTHAEAFRFALLCLEPGDEDKPIRLEQDMEGDYRKPLEQGAQPRPEAVSQKAKRRADAPKVRV